VAREEAVFVSINSDAHSGLDFANPRDGVGKARRGWLEVRGVLKKRRL
jgi:DNA polymerase (family 10)